MMIIMAVLVSVAVRGARAFARFRSDRRFCEFDRGLLIGCCEDFAFASNVVRFK